MTTLKGTPKRKITAAVLVRHPSTIPKTATVTAGTGVAPEKVQKLKTGRSAISKIATPACRDVTILVVPTPARLSFFGQ